MVAINFDGLILPPEEKSMEEYLAKIAAGKVSYIGFTNSMSIHEAVARFDLPSLWFEEAYARAIGEFERRPNY